MKSEKLISFCDKGMAFSFFALIYFLPISIALAELFTALALFFYLLKRGSMFYEQLKADSSENGKKEFLRKTIDFFKAFTPVPNCLNWPIAVLLIYSFLSVVLSQYPKLSFWAFMGKTLQGAFLYFNFIECMNSRKRLKIFLTVLFVSSLLICTNGFYQYFVGHGFIHGYVFEGTIKSSLRQQNDFAAYLLVVIPVLFSLFLIGIFLSRKIDASEDWRSFVLYFKKLSVLLFIGFIMAFACLGLTYCRGAWIAFILSLVFFGTMNRKMLLPFFLVILIFGTFFFPKLNTKRNPIHDRVSFLWQNNRLGYWKRAIDVIKDYPVLGSGLNTYSLVSQRYTEGWGGYPHNSYLQMISEVGIIGFGIFSWMLAALFHASFRAVKQIKIQSQKILLIGCLTGLTAFLIHSFFDTNFYSVQLGSLLWLAIGLVVAVQKMEAVQ